MQGVILQTKKNGYMKYFRRMIEHFIPVNEKEWLQVRNIFNKVFVKKGTIVHQEGEIFSDIWLIFNEIYSRGQRLAVRNILHIPFG